MQTKFCSKCGLEKPVSEFYKTKRNKDGYHIQCKEFDIKYAAKYYTKNTDEILNVHKEWQTNNPDKFKQSMENYRKSEEGRIADKLQHKKKREKMNQLPYTLTEDEWIQCLEHFNYSCAYCGSVSNIQKDHFVSIFNDGSYSKDNILPACGFCNPSKGDSDFFNWYPKQEFYNKEREEKILKYLSIGEYN